MNTALKQADFQIPEDLLNELQTTVGKSELSKFVSRALKRELQRLRQQTAIDEAFGIWKGKGKGDLPGLLCIKISPIAVLL
ncbi:MAG: hypothetical protein GX874_06645 [Smithella sp.]|jgi:hypothetical protein|nr:hypothetical protein [Smithella sp.]